MGPDLDYSIGAQSGGDDARFTGSTSRLLCKTNQSRLSARLHDRHRERFRRLGNITLEGVKNSSKGSGATPVGSLAPPPRKLDHQKEPPLERKRSNRDSGATVEDISKGYPN